MNSITTFDINKEALLDLLRGIQQGRIQLPDFQRSWVWDDYQVCCLLSSISLGYPIGVVMLLQLGNPKVRFKPRLLDGVQLQQPIEPMLLILDGQQRLTALFQALLSGQPVLTKNSVNKKVVCLWYYIDIQKALNYPHSEREEAIVGLSESRLLRSAGRTIDCSVPEKEYELGLFPLSELIRK